jgi:hypothetical protein
MSELVPPEPTHIFHRQFARDQQVQIWESKSINAKARVVCANCNNGWMSKLEQDHAKPAMQSLIVLDDPAILDEQRVHALVRFAFKTSVIGHAMDSAKSKYWPSRVYSGDNLRTFAKSLKVPRSIQLWVASLRADDPRTGIFRMRYAKTQSGAVNGAKFYACTFGFGKLALQLLATEWTRGRNRRQKIPYVTQDPYWNGMAIAAWPFPDISLHWPPVPLPPNLVETFCDRFSTGKIQVPIYL